MCIIDPMHNLFLGIAKRFTEILKKDDTFIAQLVEILLDLQLNNGKIGPGIHTGFSVRGGRSGSILSTSIKKPVKLCILTTKYYVVCN